MVKGLRNGMALVMMAGTLVLAAGCGGQEPSGQTAVSKQGKVLKVATEAAYPPFRYKNEDKRIVGFEVDLAKAVADRMGAQVEFTDLPFDQLLKAVEEKKADMAISAITVTDERKKQVAFSDPYYKLSGYSVVVPKENSSIRNEKDLKGKVVAAKRASTSEARLKDYEPSKILSMDHYADVFRAVESGQAQAGITGDQAAVYDLEHGGSDKLTIAGTIPTEDNFAIAMAKDNNKLREEVNTALQEIMNDGTYDSIASKWFFDHPQKQ